jgi:CcmD family protein
MDDLSYLLIGYIVIWLGLFLYILYLHMKQSKLEKDVEILEETVESHGKKEERRRRKK